MWMIWTWQSPKVPELPTEKAEVTISEQNAANSKTKDASQTAKVIVVVRREDANAHTPMPAKVINLGEIEEDNLKLK